MRCELLYDTDIHIQVGARKVEVVNNMLKDILICSYIRRKTEKLQKLFFL